MKHNLTRMTICACFATYRMDRANAEGTAGAFSHTEVSITLSEIVPNGDSTPVIANLCAGANRLRDSLRIVEVAASHQSH